MKDVYRNKVALVTGGSSGIGLATAEELVKNGAHVWVLGRSQAKLDNALRRLQSLQVVDSQSLGAISTDVAKYDEVTRAVEQITTAIGAPEVVVNSAGVTHPGYFEKMDIKDFQEDLEINYLGTVYVTKAVIPAMIARHSGIIINISSLGGIIGSFGYTGYSGSKFAVRGFSDALRAEIKPQGIQVSCVFPPDTNTPQLAFDKAEQPYEAHIISGNMRVMTPEEVAKIILNGVARGKYMILPSLPAKFWYTITTISGLLWYPIADIFIKDAVNKRKKRDQLAQKSQEKS